MKYLLINRHAKSPWVNLNVSDHERRLSDKGVSDASMMGRRLRDRKISFDLMLTSSATRALTTCQLIATQINYPLYDISVNKDIYSSNSDSLKNIIFETDNNINSLALFGHNPTLHTLSEQLSAEKLSRFPTCSMVYFKFKTNDWSDLIKCERKMLFFDYPENEQ